MQICACVYRYPLSSGVSDPPGIGLMGGCQLPDVGAENEAQALCKGRTHS